MARKSPRRPRRGLDPVGQLHPYLAYAGIVVIDLIGLVLIVTALVWVGDRAEDLLWPGGEEWVDF